MTRTVFCRKFKTEQPGLDAPPFPGPIGQDIYENVSAEAWKEWLAHQTMLINEKRLTLTDSAARAYLAEQREKFLSGEDYDIADGYVPPSHGS